MPDGNGATMTPADLHALVRKRIDETDFETGTASECYMIGQQKVAEKLKEKFPNGGTREQETAVMYEALLGHTQMQGKVDRFPAGGNKGWGLRATAAIAKGTVIGCLESNSVAGPVKDADFHEIDVNGERKVSVSTAYNHTHYCNDVAGCGAEQYYRGKQEIPNCTIDHVADLRTARDIAAGEELTWSYGVCYWTKADERQRANFMEFRADSCNIKRCGTADVYRSAERFAKEWPDEVGDSVHPASRPTAGDFDISLTGGLWWNGNQLCAASHLHAERIDGQRNRPAGEVLPWPVADGDSLKIAAPVFRGVALDFLRRLAKEACCTARHEWYLTEDKVYSAEAKLPPLDASYRRFVLVPPGVFCELDVGGEKVPTFDDESTAPGALVWVRGSVPLTVTPRDGRPVIVFTNELAPATKKRGRGAAAPNPPPLFPE